MRRSFLKPLIILSLLTFGSTPARAQEHKISIQLDQAQTEIRWSLGATLHTVHGTFKLKSGIVSFDLSTGAAQGELVLDLASGESGNGARDRNMREQVLEVEKFPQARFFPTNVRGEVKAGTAQVLTVDGRLNIHGSDHPMRIQVALQLDGSTATATAHFIVPYVEWGMHDPSTWLLRVAKVVDVEIATKGTLNAP